MKLWLLRPRENLPHEDDPWNPWYDKCFGMVIRAKTEEGARKIAEDNAEQEHDPDFCGHKISNTTTPWLDSKYSTCTELTSEGAEGLIIKDVYNA